MGHCNWEILEKIIKQWVCKHLETICVITGNYHGFVKNRLCQTNLTAFFDEVTRLEDPRNAVDIVFLDFSKCNSM